MLPGKNALFYSRRIGRGFTMLAILLWMADAPEANAQARTFQQYESFRAAFKKAPFKPMFLTWETATSVPVLEALALQFVTSRLPNSPPAFLNAPFEPIAAFSLEGTLDAYLIRGRSELNDFNVSLAIVGNDGQLMHIELVAGRKGDEGFYEEQFGWIRDLNSDGVPDLLTSKQFTKLSKDSSHLEYDSRPLQQKAWNGNQFVASNFPITAQLKTLTEENVGSFRLEQFHHWDSDPRSRNAAIQSYELWIKMYPGHSQMATARSKLQQLRNPSR